MCDRVGKSLVMQAVLSPASASPKAAVVIRGKRTRFRFRAGKEGGSASALCSSPLAETETHLEDRHPQHHCDPEHAASKAREQTEREAWVEQKGIEESQGPPILVRTLGALDWAKRARGGILHDDSIKLLHGAK